MSAAAKVEDSAITAASMEHVLGTGDLSKLSTAQRVEYYGHVCRTLGLNPLTRPFRFMSFQGQTVLYATRDCSDQLRSLHKISITIADKQLDGDLFIVTARASTPAGRSDEDVGAVTVGRLQGEARANAVMKALTKAKRRVTMSICGLGFLDESEVETLQGATTYDAEAEPPLVKLTHTETPIAPKRQTAREWLTAMHTRLAACTSIDEVEQIAASDKVRWALGPTGLLNGALRELNAILADAMERLQPGLEAEVETAFAAENDDTFPGDRPNA